MPFDLTRFRGIFPAALTMFDRENKLDEEATARHWDWLITQQGADGLVIAGTSGEFIALEREERIRLFRLAREVVRNRVTIQLSEEAQKCGADALIIILPYFQRPPKTAVIEHYRRIRQAINLPIMLYNNPLNSACVELNPREIARLVEEDVLHMVKSTFGTVEPVHDLHYLVGDKMSIFYGSFLAALEGLAAGAHGWISGVLNVVCKAAKAMYQAVVVHNDVRKGLYIWSKILPIVHMYTYQQVGPVSDLAMYRSILKCWGLPGGYCRDPYFPLDEGQEKTLRDLLQRSGWINPDHVIENLD
jgi:4-hydroxy-tetrahydrodipicolinate synthase